MSLTACSRFEGRCPGGSDPEPEAFCTPPTAMGGYSNRCVFLWRRGDHCEIAARKGDAQDKAGRSYTLCFDRAQAHGHLLSVAGRK